MSLQVRVGSTWLTTIGPWGELKWSHSADGGCKEATWRMDLPPTFAHPSLIRGKTVRIKVGPSNVWSGVLTEPDASDSWTFTALGLSALGADYLALDAAGNTTTTPDVAIDQAISRGLPWTRPTSISTAPVVVGDATAALNTVGDLLNAYATSVGVRWGVDGNGQVYKRADPTVPTWLLSPGAGRFGLADDEYASDLFIRYLSSGAGYATATVGDATARANFGRRERGVDATPLGLLTSTQAVAVGMGMVAKGSTRLGYTNGVTASKWQLTTPGGTPACLSDVKDGALVRMHGVLSEQGQPVPFVDFVIGETSYEAGADVIGLNPVGLVARDLASVLSVTGSAA